MSLQVGGACFDPFVDAVNDNRCIYMVYIYDIYDMYDIVYTLVPGFLYFIYVRYRSHLDARRIPSQLSTGSIRQPSELGLVGGGQAGSEAPAGFL